MTTLSMVQSGWIDLVDRLKRKNSSVMGFVRSSLRKRSKPYQPFAGIHRACMTSLCLPRGTHFRRLSRPSEAAMRDAQARFLSCCGDHVLPGCSGGGRRRDRRQGAAGGVVRGRRLGRVVLLAQHIGLAGGDKTVCVGGFHKIGAPAGLRNLHRNRHRTALPTQPPWRCNGCRRQSGSHAPADCLRSIPSPAPGARWNARG